MNLSGILVSAEPSRVDDVVAALRALPGIDVDRIDRERGRIVVIQEAADVGAEVEGFGRVRALPHVRSADLVCHVFEDDDGPAPSPAPKDPP